jgi:uncharacterized protein (DUF2236 family)
VSVGATKEAREPGWFGPDSVVWRLHADPCMLAGGMRALLVQALEPRAMAGVAQHSAYKEDPWGRLRRTTEFVYATTYGDAAAAEAACARVRAVHTRVRGIDPETGRAYRADDPDLLLWIHAVEVDSFVTAYRAYAGRLSDADADRYTREMGRVAEAVELPSAMVPQTYGEIREYLASMTGLVASKAAREGMGTILNPPMPVRFRPLWAVVVTATMAILPSWVRGAYGLPWPPGVLLPVRMNVYAITRAMNLLLPRAPIIREARAQSAA